MANGVYIGGRMRPASSGQTALVIDPSTGEPFAEVAAGGATDIDAAVQEADAAFAERRWLSYDPLERGRILGRVAALLRERTEELSALMAREMGMPINAATFVEIPLVANTFDYFAGLVGTIHGDTLPFSITGAAADQFVFTLKEPLGVAGLITPWNFPLLMPAWKIAPALAAGCSVVLKPAPQSPLTALRLAEICTEAGVPEGIVNVVPGGDEAGAALVAHPGVAKISFTGETNTGRKILTNAAQGIKRVSLELGGKSANIVFADADFEQAVSGALFGIFLNSGQVCQAGSRLLVQRPIYEQMLDALVARARTLTVGPAQDFTAELGPLVSREQRDRVAAYVAGAKQSGARLLVGGAAPAGDHLPAGGFYWQPTIFADVTPEMAIAREEVFGPVLAVIPFDDEAEALQIANSSIYGLAAAVWSRDLKRSLRMARGLQAGTVWLNAYQMLSPTAPFGGFKQSGIGRELGRHALEAYLETKTVIAQVSEEPLQFF